MPSTTIPDLPTVTLEGVEILRPGRWNGRVYTPKDIDDLYQSYQELRGVHKVPIKLGHDDGQALAQEDGYPALGWADRVYKRGQRLLGDFSNVPAKFAALVRAKGYRTRSAEIYFNTTFNGKHYPAVLKAVAFLGADTPAVNGLDDVLAMYSAQRRPTWVETRAVTLALQPKERTMSQRVTLATGPSHDDIEAALQAALNKVYQPCTFAADSDDPDAPPPDGGADGPSSTICMVYGDAVVVYDGDGDAYFEIPYVMSGGVAQLGEPQQVQLRPTPVDDGQQADGDEDGTGDGATDGDGQAGGDGAAGDGEADMEAYTRRLMASWPSSPTHNMLRAVIRANLKSGDPADAINKVLAQLDSILDSAEPAVAGGRGAPDWRAAVRMARRALSAIKPKGGGGDQSGGTPAQGKPDGSGAKPAPVAKNSRTEADMALQRFAKTFGLPETATDEQIQAKAIELQATHVSLSDHRAAMTRLEALERESAERDADALVAQALRQGKLASAQRDWARTYCLSDRKGFEAYVAAAPVVVDLSERGSDAGVKPGESFDTLKGSPIAQKVALSMGVDPETIAQPHVTLAERLAKQQEGRQMKPSAAPTYRAFTEANA